MSENENIPKGVLDKSFFREWLEKLQQESWQLELIISGFALYGIYNSKGALVDFANYASNSSHSLELGLVVTLFNVGWKIFFINLLVHVILRSLWIGAIGLRYVSGEIDYEELNYSDYFTKYLKRKVGDYDDFIEKLERVCSVLFSYTFLLFLFFMSVICFAAFFLIPTLIINWLDLDLTKNFFGTMLLGMTFLSYVFFGLVVFIDFITFGIIKRYKNETFAKIYMPVYRFYSTITFSFLYRPLLYNFIDDKYTRRLFLLSIPYICLIAFGSKIVTDNNIPHIPKQEILMENGMIINPKWYDDLYKERLSFVDDTEIKESKSGSNFRLSSFYMEDDIESIFLKHHSGYNNILGQKKKIKPLYKSGLQFSLFSKDDFGADEVKEALKKKNESKYESINSKYISIRDSIIRFKIDPSYPSRDSIKLNDLKVLKDSLTKKKDQIRINNSEIIKNYNNSKRDTIMDVLLSLVDISIDSTNINDRLTCYFTEHPNNGEKGIRCFFKTTDLSDGLHNFNLTRIYSYRKDMDSLFQESLVLPFIKR